MAIIQDVCRLPFHGRVVALRNGSTLWKPRHGIKFCDSGRKNIARLARSRAIKSDLSLAEMEHEADGNDLDATANSGCAEFSLGPVNENFIKHEKELVEAVSAEACLHSQVDDADGGQTRCPELDVLQPYMSRNLTCAQSSNTKKTDEVLPNLCYTISDKSLRDAMLSSNAKESFWQFDMYQNELGEKPCARYCTSKESFERVAKYFEGEKILGFDLEWKIGAERSDPWWHCVSVVQLASQSQIGIFHVAQAVQNLMDKRKETRRGSSEHLKDKHIDHPPLPQEVIPNNLRSILEDMSIIKAGVNISGDRTRLATHCEIYMKGTFELSHLYKLVKYSATQEYLKIDRRRVGLDVQVQDHLTLPLWKGEVRGSNWFSRRLTQEQIQYAASDAYAGLMLFYEMDSKRMELKPVPPRPEFDETKLPIKLAEGVVLPKLEALPAQAAKVDDHNKLKRTESTQAIRSDIVDGDQDNLLKAAYEFADGWHTSNAATNKKISKAALRAYYLWHEGSLKVDNVCEILRTPPLKERTVVGYVWNVVKRAKLTHDNYRFSDEIAPLASPLWDYVGRKHSREF